MINQRVVLAGVALLALGGAGNWWLHRPITQAAGMLIDAETRQSVRARCQPINRRDY